MEEWSINDLIYRPFISTKGGWKPLVLLHGVGRELGVVVQAVVAVSSA